ncbi:MAG: SAM-dependent methyltransferase [Firmicutes bacterium]|nr:SAM-dependent methyltransferase [Bacillota bacterium]
MKDECLICGAPLKYLETEKEMECFLCHKKAQSNACCEQGHYVCDECHSKGVDSILGLCLKEESKDPLEIFGKLVDLPFCHMHGPEHHILVGSALLTAYKNSGGDIDLAKALAEMQVRGGKVPGGICGFWGSCGAAISTGIFVSIVTGSTPLAEKEWGLCNLMTSRVLNAVGTIGGPRCCKRNGYTAIREAVGFAAEHLGVTMELSEIICRHREQNNQCIGTRCPYFE